MILVVPGLPTRLPGAKAGFLVICRRGVCKRAILAILAILVIYDILAILAILVIPVKDTGGERAGLPCPVLPCLVYRVYPALYYPALCTHPGYTPGTPTLPWVHPAHPGYTPPYPGSLPGSLREA